MAWKTQEVYKWHCNSNVVFLKRAYTEAIQGQYLLQCPDILPFSTTTGEKISHWSLVLGS